jgi:hypothetical protein
MNEMGHKYARIFDLNQPKRSLFRQMLNILNLINIQSTLILGIKKKKNLKHDSHQYT